jgi:hypothetical protein
MAGPNSIGVQKSGVKVGQKPQLSAKEKLRFDLEKQVLNQLGLSDSSQLPAEAQGTLRQTLDDQSKNLEGVKPKSVAGLVQRSIARAQGKAFEAKTQPDGSIKVPSDSKLFTKANQDGSNQLTGSLTQGPVKALMQEVGINPMSFGPQVQKALSGAQGADLGNSKNWNRFSKRLLEAHVRDQPLTGVSQAARLSGANASASSVAVDSSNKAADLGLAKSARTAEEISKVDTAETPEAVMNNESVRDPGAAAKRGQVGAKIHKIMADAGMTAEQQNQFAPFLDKALKEGQASAKNPTEKGWQVVRSTHRQMTGKKMPADKGGVADSNESREGVSMLGASQLYDLAETKTDAKLDRAGLNKMQSTLRDFAEAGETKSASASTSSTSRAEPSAASSSAGPATSKRPGTGGNNKATAAKEAAHAQLEAMGIDAKDPMMSHVVKDVESAFSQVMNGAKDDADIALRGIKWVERKVGDKTGAHSKQMESALKDLPEGSPIPESLKQFSLQQVGLCAGAGPESYMQHINQGMIPPAGAGGAVPPFGGANIGGMTTPYGGGPAMPMGGGVPGAAYGSNQQQVSTNMRCLQASMILNDPSLSMEDKIMYFLMILAAGQDADRIRKMREITDLDAKDAAKQQMKEARVNQRAAEKLGQTEETSDSKPTAESVSGTSTDKPATASSAKDVNSSGPQKVAPTKEEAVKAQLEAENELEGTHSNEGPKSKEILMMELKRITELRSMLLQMVNEILRKSNENVRNIWRG